MRAGLPRRRVSAQSFAAVFLMSQEISEILFDLTLSEKTATLKKADKSKRTEAKLPDTE